MKIKGNENEILECPKCGYGEYYVITVASGKGSYSRMFDPNSHETADNTNMYDGVDLKNQKTAYCVNCNVRIGTIIPP